MADVCAGRVGTEGTAADGAAALDRSTDGNCRARLRTERNMMTMIG